MIAPDRSALDRTLAALADPARRGVVDLLRAEPRTAGELAESLGMTPPALSRHLRRLRAEGLVEEARSLEDARVHVYCLRPAPFLELGRWIEEVEAFWGGQLAAFKAHAEGRRAPKRRDR